MVRFVVSGIKVAIQVVTSRHYYRQRRGTEAQAAPIARMLCFV